MSNRADATPHSQIPHGTCIDSEQAAARIFAWRREALENGRKFSELGIGSGFPPAAADEFKVRLPVLNGEEQLGVRRAKVGHAGPGAGLSTGRPLSREVSSNALWTHTERHRENRAEVPRARHSRLTWGT